MRSAPPWRCWRATASKVSALVHLGAASTRRAEAHTRHLATEELAAALLPDQDLEAAILAAMVWNGPFPGVVSSCHLPAWPWAQCVTLTEALVSSVCCRVQGWGSPGAAAQRRWDAICGGPLRHAPGAARRRGTVLNKLAPAPLCATRAPSKKPAASARLFPSSLAWLRRGLNRLLAHVVVLGKAAVAADGARCRCSRRSCGFAFARRVHVPFGLGCGLVVQVSAPRGALGAAIMPCLQGRRRISPPWPGTHRRA